MELSRCAQSPLHWRCLLASIHPVGMDVRHQGHQRRGYHTMGTFVEQVHNVFLVVRDEKP